MIEGRKRKEGKTNAKHSHKSYFVLTGNPFVDAGIIYG